MKLVLLAAGHGRRFGGLKQLAPVGPSGEAIIDYTARQARSAGYTGAVIVVRAEIEREILDHVSRFWPAELPVCTAVQRQGAGTVPAVLAAAPLLDEPFAVANADDLYDETGLAAIAAHLAHRGDEAAPHVLVGYRLASTVLTPQPVKRGLCVTSPEGLLEDLVEHTVFPRPDGTFEAVRLGHEHEQGAHPEVLLGAELVSMNLWGFQPDVIGLFRQAAKLHLASGEQGELLLPQVLGNLVRVGETTVRVLESAGRTIGITHRDDLPVVRQAINELAHGSSLLASGRAAS